MKKRAKNFDPSNNVVNDSHQNYGIQKYIPSSSSISICENNPCLVGIECFPFGIPYCRYNCVDGRTYVPFNETCPPSSTSLQIDNVVGTSLNNVYHSIMSWHGGGTLPSAAEEGGGGDEKSFFSSDNAKYLYLIALVPGLVLIFCLCCCRKRTPRNPPKEKEKSGQKRSVADNKPSSETENIE